MTKHTFLAPLLALVLASCGDDSGSGDPAKGNPIPESGSTAIGAEGVELVSHSIEAGNPPANAIETGLQAAADTLSGLYADALKEYPDLTGHIRGTFHIEPDGTVRMFAAKDSEFSPEEGKSISSAFIGATFGGKYKFPDLGENVLLKIDFQLKSKG